MNDTNQSAGELRWVHVLQGITTLSLGLIALFWPGLTLVSLLYVLVVYAMIIGIIDVVVGVTSIGVNRNWWLHVIVGIVMLGVAAYLVRNPDIARSLFVFLAGIMLIVRGLFNVVAATMGNETSEDRSAAVMIGFLGVLAGIVVWVYPVGVALGFVWVLGLFAMISGIASIARAIRASNQIRIGQTK